MLRANGIQPRHCEIRIDAGRATLRALDFRTWLNNGPVRQVEIHVGDRLTVGPLEFRVTAHTQVEEAAPSPVATVPTQPSPVSHTPPAVADHVTAVSERQREAENRLAETESRLLRQADEIQSRLQSLMASEEGVAEKLARIHEQELALARRSATLEVQSTVARVAPVSQLTPPTSIPAATTVPDFVVQATRRQAEEEARLAHREAQLQRETAELQSRVSALAANEEQLAQRLSQIHEQELALVRRSCAARRPGRDRPSRSADADERRAGRSRFCGAGHAEAGRGGRTARPARSAAHSAD